MSPLYKKSEIICKMCPTTDRAYFIICLFIFNLLSALLPL
nr:MAG TPA: hypothetical protein [Caudoviricetes sp.]